jgi:hypothetical protein
MLIKLIAQDRSCDAEGADDEVEEVAIHDLVASFQVPNVPALKAPQPVMHL